MTDMTMKPKVRLVGEDGNAFAIIGRCWKAARAGEYPLMTKEEWDKVMAEMKSGDYNHLLATVLKYFDEDGDKEDPCRNCIEMEASMGYSPCGECQRSGVKPEGL